MVFLVTILVQVCVLIFIVDLEDRHWVPAEAKTRVETMYDSTDLDRETGMQVPDTRSPRKVAVIDFRTADGSERTAHFWWGNGSRDEIAQAPRTVSILYHDQWTSEEFDSATAARAEFLGTEPFSFTGAWVASTGKYVAESRYLLPPKLDDAWIQFRAWGVTWGRLVPWWFFFVLLALLSIWVQFSHRRQAIALLAAEAEGKTLATK